MIVLSAVVLAFAALVLAVSAFGGALPPAVLVALAFACAWCAAGLVRELKALHAAGAFVRRCDYPVRAVVRWDGNVVVLECGHKMKIDASGEDLEAFRSLERFTCEGCA